MKRAFRLLFVIAYLCSCIYTHICIYTWLCVWQQLYIMLSIFWTFANVTSIPLQFLYSKRLLSLLVCCYLHLACVYYRYLLLCYSDRTTDCISCFVSELVFQCKSYFTVFLTLVYRHQFFPLFFIIGFV